MPESPYAVGDLKKATIHVSSDTSESPDIIHAVLNFDPSDQKHRKKNRRDLYFVLSHKEGGWRVNDIVHNGYSALAGLREDIQLYTQDPESPREYPDASSGLRSAPLGDDAEVLKKLRERYPEIDQH